MKEKRRQAGMFLNQLRIWVRETLEENPNLRDIKKSNDLIRYIWRNYSDDIKAESILRLARVARIENPELDTRFNIENRANAETAYRQYLST